MEDQNVQEYMLVGRVLSMTNDAVEIELAPGLVVALDRKAALKVEEYTDPATGVGVANIFFKADEDIAAALRPRAVNIATRDARVPFVFGPLPVAAPAAPSALKTTSSCYTTNPTTGDCGPDDPSQAFTARPPGGVF